MKKKLAPQAQRAQEKLLRLDRPTQKRLIGAMDLLADDGRGDVRNFEGGEEYGYRLRVGE